MRLLALFAMHLMAAERERLKVFAFDEGWRLLADPAGRLLLAALQRMGRSELAVPIIGTQLVTDALDREALDNLVGATLRVRHALGRRGRPRARPARARRRRRALRRSLLELRPGQCLMRDHHGRVEAVQIDLAAPRLLAALSTTPTTAETLDEAAA